MFFYGRELFSVARYQESYEVYDILLQTISDIDQISYVLEKTMFCLIQLKDENKLALQIARTKNRSHPRIQLIKADIACILDPQIAKKLYLEYIQNPLLQESTKYEYTYERYMVHPHFQLAKIAIHSDDLENAKYHLQKVINTSHLPETKYQAKILYNRINI
jgi:hypothetical protein